MLQTIHPEEVRTGLSNTILTMRGYVAGREGLPKVAFELLNAVEGLVYYILSNLEGTVRDADDMEYCMKRISAFLRMLDELQVSYTHLIVVFATESGSSHRMGTKIS